MMATKLYWFQHGNRRGDTYSFLSAGTPAMVERFSFPDIQTFRHPTRSDNNSTVHQRIPDSFLKNSLSGEEKA